jgi:legumain
MWNYRHQADICGAYQLIKSNGIPEDHIIVMAVDDLVNDEENPFPGQLFNEPNGPDVYAGCNIDYRGSDLVTPDTFHAVLRGNISALPEGGKYLKSTSESNVFLFFSDHGELGYLMFPEHQ